MAYGAGAGGSVAGPSDPMVLLNSLPFAHPSFLPLLSRIPWTNDTTAQGKGTTKLLGRLNSSLLGSSSFGASSTAEKAAGWKIARELLRANEPLVVDYGKGWLDSALSSLQISDLPVAAILAPLDLIRQMITLASRYPSFERESVQPLLGKLAVSLSRILERALAEGDYTSLGKILSITLSILCAYPAPFRPVTPALRALLSSLLLGVSSSTGQAVHGPTEIKTSAARLFAHLHLTAGKAQGSQVWAGDMKDALAGMAYAVGGVVHDAVMEDPLPFNPPSSSSALPALPPDPASRIGMAIGMLEGYTEMVIALSNVSTSRAVQVPLSVLVHTSLRFLRITLDTPIASHISPQHHAVITSNIPRLWTSGLSILGTTMTSCDDHLLPHLSNVLDHATWLLERTPSSLTSSTLQILAFHFLFYTLYPPALVPIDYPTRLVKFCLTQISGLLERRILSSSDGVAGLVNGAGGTGKRGKKRARGNEDGLIGSLEGRQAAPIQSSRVEVVLACLKLVPCLHSTPLLSPSLLTLSIRVHLSTYLHLQCETPSSFSKPEDLSQLKEGVSTVLEEALLMTENQSGTSKGWKSVILSVLRPRGERFSFLLHPSVPPMMRQQPPLSALHLYAPEGEEEKRIRTELGIARSDGDDVEDGAEGNDRVMEIDQVESRQETTIDAVDVAKVALAAVAPSRPPQAVPGIQTANSTRGTAPAPSPSTALTTAGPSTSVVSSQVIDAPMAMDEGRTNFNPDHTRTGASTVVHTESESATTTTFVDGSKRVETMTEVTSTSNLGGTGKVTEDDDEDGPIPELDSGSSVGFGSDDEEEENEENEAA